MDWIIPQGLTQPIKESKRAENLLFLPTVTFCCEQLKPQWICYTHWANVQSIDKTCKVLGVIFIICKWKRKLLVAQACTKWPLKYDWRVWWDTCPAGLSVTRLQLRVYSKFWEIMQVLEKAVHKSSSVHLGLYASEFTNCEITENYWLMELVRV